MKRRARMISGVILVVAAGVAAADKPIWLLTDEERLAARFAPGASQARVRAAMESGKAGQPMVAGEGTPVMPTFTEAVDGSRNPELLLPIELFNDVVLQAYVMNFADTTVFREESLGRWREFGLSRDPDPVLRAETASMVALLEKDRERASTKAPDDKDHGLTSPYCGETFDAFQRVEAALGPGDFAALLHLLYATVAPGRSSFTIEPLERVEAMLRARARGCR